MCDITGGGQGGGLAVQPCLFMLFPEGRRPTSRDVRGALARVSCGQVSYDPADSEAAVTASDWLELVVDGLTFDVLGLAPGKGLTIPAPRHLFGISQAALAGHEAIGLAPGPHIASAANALPVVRTLLRLGAALASEWEAAFAMVWPPAASVMHRAGFSETIGAWLAGGAFPALGLTGVVARGDGALASDGLAFFTGRELVLDPALGGDRVAATRLMTRLIDRLVHEPPFDGVSTVRLETGAILRLTAQGGVITVAPG